jgi:prephenate dehydrogenase
LAAASASPADALLTDVGSAKAVVVRELERQLPSHSGFVGSHPLAGSEKRGPGFAYDRLFEGRVVVLTPTPKTSAQALQHAVEFWEGMGTRVVQMTPEEHDVALALTSHLPHVAASALAGILPKPWHQLTAGGFRDTTRIAAGDPALWSAICLQNKEAIVEALKQFEAVTGRFRADLEAGNAAAVMDFLIQGKRNRDALGS